jgi:hypothetical protein
MLKAIYDNAEEIPTEYASLYTERNGQFELSGIEGIKTAGDVDRLSTALSNERNAHKSTKAQYGWVGDLSSDDVQGMRDAQEDLRHQLDVAPQGLTNEQVEERANTMASRQTRAMERELAGIRNERDAHAAAIQLHEGAAAQRNIRDAVDSSLTGKHALSIVDSAKEDIVPFAERIMTVDSQGQVVTRDGVGFEPGLPFSEVLAELQASGRRSHWFPANQGAGATGSAPGNTPSVGTNPFSADSFNLTDIGKVVKADPARARTMAKAAGVDPAGFGL